MIEWGRKQNQDFNPSAPPPPTPPKKKKSRGLFRIFRKNSCLMSHAQNIKIIVQVFYPSKSCDHPPLSCNPVPTPTFSRAFFSLEQGSFLQNEDLNDVVCLSDEQKTFYCISAVSLCVSTVVQTKLGFKSSVFASVKDNHRDAYFFNVLSNQSQSTEANTLPTKVSLWDGF